MATTSFEQRRQNDLAGLTWIHRFGWLRTQELGGLMWPANNYGRTRADRIVRGWLDRKLVIVRQLPDGAGRAVVLSEAGARVLREAGIDAKSGKDWGETEKNCWRPERDWRHDLLAVGVLVDLHSKGYHFLSEREVRQANKLAKIPDGLAWRGSEVLWLEVESARKTGKPMADLASMLIVVAEGQCKSVSGLRPNSALVVYAEAAKDERDMNLNHAGRVRTAVRKLARHDVNVTWAKCSMSGCGVALVTYEQERIGSDLAAQILARLEWRDEDGCFVATYGDHLCYVWDDEDMGWSYQIEGGGVSNSAYQAANKTTAMRGCTGLLAIR